MKDLSCITKICHDIIYITETIYIIYITINHLTRRIESCLTTVLQVITLPEILDTFSTSVYFFSSRSLRQHEPISKPKS